MINVVESPSLSLKEKFAYLSFDSEKHEYRDTDGGNIFDSVSSVIESISPIFDVEKISKRAAEKEDISQDEVKLRWNIRRDFSIVRGTEFHLYVEKYLTENRKIKHTTNIANEIQSFHQFWDNNHKKECEVIDCEIVIGDKNWRISGTVDCLIRAKSTHCYYLFDWKTNQKIRTHNQFQKFKSPINIDFCELNKYSLQMNFYKLILERNANIKINNCFLIHFTEKQYNVISCHDYSDLIVSFLDHRSQ